MRFTGPLFIILMLLLQTTAGICASASLDPWLTPKNVSQMTWQTVLKEKYFRTPTESDVDKNTGAVTKYYGDWGYIGDTFTLSVTFKDEKEPRSISLAKLVPDTLENKDLSSQDKATKEKLCAIFGRSPIEVITKIPFTKGVYLQFTENQWTVGKSRVHYTVAKFVETDKGIQKYSSYSVAFSSLEEIKELVPVSFLTCNYQLTHSDGSKGRQRDLIIGIDYNAKKVVDPDYFETGFNLEDNFITLNTTNKGVDVNLHINRATGEITGQSKGENLTSSFTGRCVKVSDKKLF
jgi:hypothetical protein